MRSTPIHNASADINRLPLVGTTSDLSPSESLEHWRSIFGGIWGPVELTEIGAGNVSGTLRSQHIGELTFNRITFGNQLFECMGGNNELRNEPFYSLTFPKSGTADCFVGNTRMRLAPNHAYLINVDNTAKLRVEKHYSTFNIQIPVSGLEHRLGRRVDIAPRDVIQTDPIFHMAQALIGELLSNADKIDSNTSVFLSNQLLDTVAFFLDSGGDNNSQDSLAVHAMRARILAYFDSNYHDAELTPLSIAVSNGISRSYLYKIFSDGPSVMEHLRRRRLQAARKMIERRSKRLTLTSIAMACGFSSSSEFSRLFKKEFGTTPRECAICTRVS